MKFLLAFAAIALIAAFVAKRAFASSRATDRSDRASIMDDEPERMSLFSADHVRMLSDRQLDAMERDADETP